MSQPEMHIQDYRDRLQQILGTLPTVQRPRAEQGLKALDRLIQDLERWRHAHRPPAFTDDETAQDELLKLVDRHG